MENSNTNSTTNQEIANSLEKTTQGVNNNSTPLVFDPTTGEFVVPRANQQVSPDAITMNSIVKDGFAK